MKKFFDHDPNVFPQRGDYMERPRLHKLLKNAVNYPLVVVCAGAGYGKTRAVYSFLQEYDANTAWLQFSERDNIATRFWESYTSAVSLAVPKVGARFMEIGFPETDEAFTKFSMMVREIASLPRKQIRVLDDLHLLHNLTVLRFIERTVNMLPPNMTVILISRTTPNINLINLMMQERVFTIHEDTLCFTEDEIAGYFNQLELTITSGDTRNIYDDTQGWAFAINLIGRSLAKEQKYERYALEAMKKNIFRLIEAEISKTVSKPLWRFLLRISLIDHLAASLIKALAKDDALVKEMESLNAYIRYDFNMDTYLIHNLFRDYLRDNQDQFLTDEEKRETYQTAGEWCDANSYHMDAFSYYEKSGDYVAISRKVATLNLQIPLDMALYIQAIFDRASNDAVLQSPMFYAMNLKIKMSLAQIDEALALAESYAKAYEAQPDSLENSYALFSAYSVWGFLRMLNCTRTDIYDFDAYFEKMAEYYDKIQYPVIGTYSTMPMSAWASLVGTSRAGAQEEYLQAISKAIPPVSRILKGCFYGLDDLVRGELYYYRGEFDDAEQYLKQSVDKARTCDQYATQNRALVYLMQIAFLRGDFADATAKLQTMEALLSEKDYGIRYTMYDIACGFYHLAMGQPEHVLEWLKCDYSPYAHPSFLENYANRVKALYRYQTHQYNALLSRAESANTQNTVLFGKVGLKVVQALSLYKLKRRSEAIAAFAEAYHLAAPNKIVLSFIYYTKDMRTLTSAALKDDRNLIPREWLEDINRKSSACAKRRAKMISEYRLANNLNGKMALTERETAILKDLSQGLSRSEIAASRNISVNTVKMVIGIIYDKLYVASLPDAIRVAVDRKII